jgi:hypothetical protein
MPGVIFNAQDIPFSPHCSYIAMSISTKSVIVVTEQKEPGKHVCAEFASYKISIRLCGIKVFVKGETSNEQNIVGSTNINSKFIYCIFFRGVLWLTIRRATIFVNKAYGCMTVW